MEKYLTYIKNACNPRVKEFIEDWEPIGEQVLKDLQTQGLVFVEDNRLYVVQPSQEEINLNLFNEIKRLIAERNESDASTLILLDKIRALDIKHKMDTGSFYLPEEIRKEIQTKLELFDTVKP